MKQTLIPDPSRIRRLPAHYSWVDHRLVRQNRLHALSAEALSLYLFLLVVADKDGISYYGKEKIHKHLPVLSLATARDELIEQGLIAYLPPFYQVLEISDLVTVSANLPKVPRTGQPRSFAEIIAQIANPSTSPIQ